MNNQNVNVDWKQRLSDGVKRFLNRNWKQVPLVAILGVPALVSYLAMPRIEKYATPYGEISKDVVIRELPGLTWLASSTNDPYCAALSLSYGSPDFALHPHTFINDYDKDGHAETIQESPIYLCGLEIRSIRIYCRKDAKPGDEKRFREADDLIAKLCPKDK